MENYTISKKKVEALSNGIMLAGLGILFYTSAWWPGILLVIWAGLAVRQWLSNRRFDLIVSTIILVGLFLASFLDLKWNVLIPVLFILGGLYIIFREFFYSEDTIGEDKAEEIRDDADIDKK